jgi:anti-sigma regulatory factor (Ser/Thr protein kinase)
MKKIAYFIENYNIVEKLADYAFSEDIECIDCSNFVKEGNLNCIDHGFICLVTDKHELEIEKNDLPMVFISKKNSGKHIFELDESFDLVQFRMLIDTIYHGGKLGYFSSTFHLTSINKEIIIKNNIFEVDKVVYNITKELAYFCSLNEIQKLRIGLSEIITNSIEHGNLEITGQEKFENTEKGTYISLIVERLSNKTFFKRYVTVSIYFDKNYFKATVRDMGKGFDTEKSISTQDENDLLKLHGRGIMITKMYFDKVEYNKKGNEVTLTKRFEC